MLFIGSLSHLGCPISKPGGTLYLQLASSFHRKADYLALAGSTIRASVGVCSDSFYQLPEFIRLLVQKCLVLGKGVCN